MSPEEAFCKHMAKVYLAQAIAHNFSRSWKFTLLEFASKKRRQYLEFLRRDKKPVAAKGQLDLWGDV